MTAEPRPSKAPLRIGLIGTFDVANYGDCLFPVVYEALVGRTRSDCKFTYYSPLARDVSIRDYGPVKSLPETMNDIHFDEDVLILCGGETLDLGHSSGTFNFPSSTLGANARLWLAPTVAASRGDVAFYVHCVGMPPADGAPRPEIAEALKSATRVSLRDAVSAQRLGDIFPVETDPVFALSDLKTDGEWQEEAARWLPEGYATDGYLAAHVSAPYLEPGALGRWCGEVASIARQQNLPILLVPVCHFMDDRLTLTAARKLLLELGFDKSRVVLAPDGSENIIATAAILGKSAGVVTSSLHATVTAVSFGKPFATLVGTGRSNSKHRQTLLTVGIDYGMALEIENLVAVYAHALEQDGNRARKEAVELAKRDFAPVLQLLEAPERQTRLIPAKALERVLERDRKGTQDFRFEAKRRVLRMMNRFKPTAKLLTMRRQRRLTARWQDA